MSEQAKCELCGEPMPEGEQMFNYHGYSGPCPKPPLPKEQPSQKAMEIAARVWCDPEMRAIVMDPKAAMEIAAIVHRVRQEQGLEVQRDLITRCRGCKKPLDPKNFTTTADGCPCNSPRGINHGIVPKDTCTCTECDPAQTGSIRK